ncbi:hypothetical protein [Arthrobacter sp. 35/47]|uniref:hypothetical protein n=1 Tax=Arthrobacter sp. 35/47 TaxID=269454 RepID=UPI00047AFEA0|nr:hypothetical protein [Arthrobacter sp. 35/47]
MKDILIRDSSGGWREPLARGYANEAELQQTLAAHPQLIPGVSEGARTCREFQTEVGPADILVLEPDGTLTLVECKLASNRQVRREIIGQMFDYASRLWTMQLEDFDRRWRERRLDSPFDGATDSGIDLRAAVEANLQNARFRLVLAVDTINRDLRRIVEFLNRSLGSEISVVAVEYVRAVDGEIEILVPRSYGAEIAEVKRRGDDRQKETWDLEKHRQWMQEHDPDSLERFNQLIEQGKAIGLDYFGTASAEPTGGLRIITADETWIGTLYCYYYTGQRTSLELSFGKVRSHVGRGSLQPELDRFLSQIESDPAFAEAARLMRESGFSKRPNIPFSRLSSGSVHLLIDAVRPLISARAS